MQLDLTQMLYLIFPIVVVGIIFVILRKPKNYPPGPFALPLVGHIPYFAEYATKGGIQRLFMDWKLKFGPIVAVDFGSFKAIVLGDVSVVKLAWSLPQLTGRIQIPKVILRSSDGVGGPTRGVLFTHGRTWSEQRLFMMKHLKKYTSDKLDGIVLPEAEEVLAQIGRVAGTPVSTVHLFNPAIINVVRQIVAGDRFAHDDPNLTKVMDAITEMMHDKGVSGVVAYLPQWLVDTFPNITGWTKYRQNVTVPKRYFLDLVEERIRAYREGSRDDFIDAFIATSKATEDTDSSFYGNAGKENLVHMVLDFFDAGVETTSTVMSWLLLFLALHPTVQEKLQTEIDKVIGKRQPTISDRAEMPYADAVILETLRKSSATPLALFHRSLEQVNLCSTTIPKNTIVISNLYGIHHDPTVWGSSADIFDPDRFLDSEGSKNMLAFGTGKRLCPGDNLAKSELFLLTVATLQKFNVRTDPNSEMPTMDQEVGGIIAPPKPHKIIFTAREA